MQCSGTTVSPNGCYQTTANLMPIKRKSLFDPSAKEKAYQENTDTFNVVNEPKAQKKFNESKANLVNNNEKEQHEEVELDFRDP